MKELKIITRNIVANTVEHFEFDAVGFEFEVKNFTNNDIYVAFKETNDTSKMIKIPSKCAQNCIINKRPAFDNFSRDVYVYSEGSGEVEVQCLKF